LLSCKAIFPEILSKITALICKYGVKSLLSDFIGVVLVCRYFPCVAIENNWMIKVYHIMKTYKHIFFKVNLYALLSKSIDSQILKQVRVAGEDNL